MGGRIPEIQSNIMMDMGQIVTEISITIEKADMIVTDCKVTRYNSVCFFKFCPIYNFQLLRLFYIGLLHD